MSLNSSPNAFQAAGDLLNQVVNQYIVRPLGNKGGGGFGGFVFDVTGDEETFFDSEITDHYTEQNSAIQDHIALRPIRFTVKGYVAELTDILQVNLNLIATVGQRLGIVDDFLPGFTYGSLQAYASIAATLSEAQSAVSQVQTIYQLFSQSNTSATKQQAAYSFFKKNWNTRQLFTIETPHDILQNMAIERVGVLQRDENRFVSDFSVTFKQIRYASTTAIPISLAKTNATPSGPLLNGKPGSNNTVPPPPAAPPGGPYNYNSTTQPNLSPRAASLLVPIENESTFSGEAIPVSTLVNITQPIFKPTIPMLLPSLRPLL